MPTSGVARPTTRQVGNGSLHVQRCERQPTRNGDWQ